MAQLAVGRQFRSNRIFAVSFRRTAVEFIEGAGHSKEEGSLRLAEMLQSLAPAGLGFGRIIHARALRLASLTSLVVRSIQVLGRLGIQLGEVFFTQGESVRPALAGSAAFEPPGIRTARTEKQENRP